jgi:hypothetical protein
MKKQIIFAIIAVVLFIITWVFIIPPVYESNIPEMKDFLKRKGYTNIQVKEVVTYKLTTIFITDQGEVPVKLKRGVYYIQ